MLLRLTIVKLELIETTGNYKVKFDQFSTQYICTRYVSARGLVCCEHKI